MKRNQNKAFSVFLSIFIGITFLCLSSIGLLEFATPLHAAKLDKDIPCEWSSVRRIVAVGDLHGAYDYFVQILEGTGLVDSSLNWIGGDAHLVQIGDVLDRGEKPKQIFDLAMRLEKEAEAAGGKVHMMIGNHEEMNLANTAFDREGYVTPQQFVQFLPEKYRLKQEKIFARKAGSKSSGDSTSNGNYDVYWQELIDKAMGQQRSIARLNYLKNLDDLYGDWILEHNVVIKINDIVFVHGGINEMFSTWTLKEINDLYRKELDDLRLAELRNMPPRIAAFDRLLFNEPEGPLWNRTLSRAESPDLEDDVSRILENLKAETIVIAHTPLTAVGEENMKKYGGRVWIIDTGIADYYRRIGGHVSALVIVDGKFSVWYPDSENKDIHLN